MGLAVLKRPTHAHCMQHTCDCDASCITHAECDCFCEELLTPCFLPVCPLDKRYKVCSICPGFYGPVCICLWCLISIVRVYGLGERMLELFGYTHMCAIPVSHLSACDRHVVATTGVSGYHLNTHVLPQIDCSSSISCCYIDHTHQGCYTWCGSPTLCHMVVRCFLLC